MEEFLRNAFQTASKPIRFHYLLWKYNYNFNWYFPKHALFIWLICRANLKNYKTDLTKDMAIFAKLSDVALGSLYYNYFQFICVLLYILKLWGKIKYFFFIFVQILDPACLLLNLDFNCFVANKNCQKRCM